MIQHESPLELPSEWSSDLISFVSLLLAFSPQSRLSSLDSIKKHPYCTRIDFAWIQSRYVCIYYWVSRMIDAMMKCNQLEFVLSSRAAPTFVPSQHCLNCDPMYEIEERVVVSTPIHDRRGRGRKSSKVWGTSHFDNIKITRTIRNKSDRELTSSPKQKSMIHSIH